MYLYVYYTYFSTLIYTDYQSITAYFGYKKTATVFNSCRVIDSILIANDPNELDSLEPKFLIFMKGSKAGWTPHEIAYKRINKSSIMNSLESAVVVDENSDDFHNVREVRDLDEYDGCIDFQGHITGMALSSDHRFLFVNCRAWPENYVPDIDEEDGKFFVKIKT